MFGHRSFLMLGSDTPADIRSLISGGYEALQVNYAFSQGVDRKGKVQTRVWGGQIKLTLPMLPPDEIMEWALSFRSYKDGVVVLCEADNLPVEKLAFTNAACVHLKVNYTNMGTGYVNTHLVIVAEELNLGNLKYESEWQH
ncbi:MAG: type VI secretion system needle protein Hcp [Prevotellaceae bacterium]|nr:type VI secretion system needle protein Hcp [Prevotellaceae bacterium]